MLRITDSKFGPMLDWEPAPTFYTASLSAIDGLWVTRACDPFDPTALFVTRDSTLAMHIAGELNHRIMWLRLNQSV
jgi:hypothetical protein